MSPHFGAADADATPPPASVERALGRIEGKLDGFTANCATHRETLKQLTASLTEHKEDTTAHGLKAIRESKGTVISTVNLILAIVMGLFAFAELRAHRSDSQGIQGSQGRQGVQGEQGREGVEGDRGSQGFQGVQGVQGRTGPRSH